MILLIKISVSYKYLEYGPGAVPRLLNSFTSGDVCMQVKLMQFICVEFTDSDTEELISDERIAEDEPSSSVEDISEKSAQIAVITAFERSSLQDLSVKAHLIPIAKQLGVRYRSKGKRDLLTPIAKQLFLQGYLESEADPVYFKKLKRCELKVIRPIFQDGNSSIDSNSEGSPATDHD